MDRKETILLAEDDISIVTMLKRLLSAAGYEIHASQNGREAFDKIKEVKPDLVLLDIAMPGMDGIELKAKLNRDEATAAIPVIFLTGRGAIGEKIEGLNLGADDYVTKPFEPAELLARVKTVLSRRRFYERISTTDDLTGLFNLHIYKKELFTLFHIAKRYRRPFSLVVVDIDNLKKINDAMGHKAGDFIIQKTAEIMKQIFRKADILIRYGGDEFVILLPESNEKQTAVAIDRLKAAIDGKEFMLAESGTKISFTISTGIATYDDALQTETELFQLADKNMYREKCAKKIS